MGEYVVEEMVEYCCIGCCGLCEGFYFFGGEE